MLLSTADVAASGETSFALIGGEAGVGKSRLVTETAARLRDRGWTVLEGGAVPLGDDGLPFGPITEALRELVREVDADRIKAAAGSSLPDLARLVPELSETADDGPRADGTGLAAGPHLRRRPAASRPARRGRADRARRGGPPLGRPFDA